MRRQYDRRRRRMAKIRNLLQKAGLLPKDKDFAKAILKLDAQALIMLGKTKGINKQTLAHVAPYALRGRALDAKLDPYFLGRAFYHLSQRRGFLSNRKEKIKGGDKDEAGVVKPAIEQLANEMKNAKARTLGEYFAGIDPEASRIRERYTHREMYLAEFDAIWKKQQKFHPEILGNVRKCVTARRRRGRGRRAGRSRRGACARASSSPSLRDECTSSGGCG